MLDDVWKHVPGGVFSEDAIDVTVIRDDLSIVEGCPVRTGQPVQGDFGAPGQIAGILRPGNKERRHCHAVEMLDIDIVSIQRHHMSRSTHRRYMLEASRIRHAEHFVEVVEGGPVQLIELIQLTVQE